MKKKLVGCAVLVAVGLVFVPLMGIWRGLYKAADAREVLKILCDCFTVPGLIYLCLGLLFRCGEGGAFDMLGYGTKLFFGVFSPKKREAEKESFYEYRMRKRTSKKPVADFLIVGGGFTAIALVFLMALYLV